MAENFAKEAPETGKAKQTDEVFQKESGKDFGDIIKTDGETGKDFADLLKDDADTGKDFVDALKEDADTGKDFSDSFKGPIADGFSRQDTPPLSDDDKAKIKEETGWPDEIVDNIATMEEYEIYKEAGLVAIEINGKWCLIRSDIDMDQKDELGKTNKERMEQGLAPLDKNGKPIELHHIGQKSDSPLAELTQDEHRGKGNDATLHDKKQDSEIDRKEFQEEKQSHWKERA
jgi:hypothetical protein